MFLNVRADHLKIIQQILNEYVPQHKVIAFGSRTSGKAKDTSDLDICIMSNEHLSFETMAHIKDAFSLSTIPYRVDLIDWASVSPEFQQIIMQHYFVIQNQ